MAEPNADNHANALAELTLSSPRLELRPWTSEDVEPIVRIMRAPAMHRFLALPDPYTEADARAFVTSIGPAERTAGTGIDSAVIERDTRRLVGSATLRLPVGTRHADIGYWIAPDAQGNGYATEATTTLARWAFEHGVHRVELRLDVANLASAHVAMRAGFGFEGVRRDFLPTPAGRSDLAVFVRTADDPGDPIPSAFPQLPAAGLSDGTLTVRDLAPDDLEAYVEMECDPVTVEVGFTGVAPSRRLMERTLARAGLDRLVGALTRFALVDTASGAFAGTLMIRMSGPPNVGGIGYGVHPDFRGRGFTARALRLVAAWALEGDSFARLELGAKRDNIASQKAALSGGFAADGIRTARLRNSDGTFSDEVRFVLINPHYGANPSAVASPPRRIKP